MIALVALGINFLFLLGQLYSLCDWDTAVMVGLQEDRFTGDAAEKARARLDWGNAIADMIVQVPLTVVAFVGLLITAPFAYDVALLALAICVYWPFIFVGQRGGQDCIGEVIAILIFVLLSILAILGLAANRDDFHPHQSSGDYGSIAMAPPSEAE